MSPAQKPFITQEAEQDLGVVLGGTIQVLPVLSSAAEEETEISVLVQITFRCAKSFWLPCPKWPPEKRYVSSMKLEYGTGDQSQLNSMKVTTHKIAIHSIIICTLQI